MNNSAVPPCAIGSGTLGPDEIRNGLSQLGFDKKGKAGIDKLVKKADADGSGEIDITEFVDMISNAMSNGEMKESQMDLVEVIERASDLASFVKTRLSRRSALTPPPPPTCPSLWL